MLASDSKQNNVLSSVIETELFREIDNRFREDGGVKKEIWRYLLAKISLQIRANNFSLETFNNGFKTVLTSFSKKVDQNSFSSSTDEDVASAIRKQFPLDTSTQYDLPVNNRKVRALYEYGRLLLSIAARNKEQELLERLEPQRAKNVWLDGMKVYDLAGTPPVTVEDTELEIKRAKEACVNAQLVKLNIELVLETPNSYLSKKEEKLKQCEATLKEISSQITLLNQQASPNKGTFKALKDRFDTLQLDAKNLEKDLSNEELRKIFVTDLDDQKAYYFSEAIISQKVKELTEEKAELESSLAALRKKQQTLQAFQAKAKENGEMLDILDQAQCLRQQFARIQGLVRETSLRQTTGFSNAWKTISAAADKYNWPPITKNDLGDVKKLRAEETAFQTNAPKWTGVEFNRMEALYLQRIARINIKIQKWEAQRNQEIQKTDLVVTSADLTEVCKRITSIVDATKTNSPGPAGVEATKIHSPDDVKKQVPETNVAEIFEKVSQKIQDQKAKNSAEEADMKREIQFHIEQIQAQETIAKLVSQLDGKKVEPIIIPAPIESVRAKTVWEETPTWQKLVLGICTLGIWSLVRVIQHNNTIKEHEKNLAKPITPKSAPLPPRDRERNGNVSSLHRVNSEPHLQKARRGSCSAGSSAYIDKATHANPQDKKEHSAVQLNIRAAKNLILGKLLTSGNGFSRKYDKGGLPKSVSEDKLIHWKPKDNNTKLVLVQPLAGLVIDGTKNTIEFNGVTYYLSIPPSEQGKDANSMIGQIVSTDCGREFSVRADMDFNIAISKAIGVNSPKTSLRSRPPVPIPTQNN